jgi:hypothetical protein
VRRRRGRRSHAGRWITTGSGGGIQSRLVFGEFVVDGYRGPEGGGNSGGRTVQGGDEGASSAMGDRRAGPEGAACWEVVTGSP